MELNRWVGFPIPTAPGPNTTADTRVDFPPLETKNGDSNSDGFTVSRFRIVFVINGVLVIQGSWGFPMDRKRRGSVVTNLSNRHHRNQRAASALQHRGVEVLE